MIKYEFYILNFKKKKMFKKRCLDLGIFGMEVRAFFNYTIDQLQ